jgi:hypothetical protein
MDGTYIKIVRSICRAVKKLPGYGRSMLFYIQKKSNIFGSLQQLRRSDPSQGYMEVAGSTGMPAHLILHTVAAEGTLIFKVK